MPERIYDDGYGKLLLKDEKGRLVVAEIGSVNYDTGLIKLNSFKPLAADDNVIGVTVLPSHDDIVTKNNQILSLSTLDVSITMIDDASVISGSTVNPDYTKY